MYKVLCVRSCVKCLSDVIEPFAVLECKDCAKIRKNYTKFKETIETLLKRDISHINNVIDVAKICNRYPKFLKLNATFSDIKKYKSKIKKNDVMVRNMLAKF